MAPTPNGVLGKEPTPEGQNEKEKGKVIHVTAPQNWPKVGNHGNEDAHLIGPRSMVFGKQQAQGAVQIEEGGHQKVRHIARGSITKAGTRKMNHGLIHPSRPVIDAGFAVEFVSKRPVVDKGEGHVEAGSENERQDRQRRNGDPSPMVAAADAATTFRIGQTARVGISHPTVDHTGHSWNVQRFKTIAVAVVVAIAAKRVGHAGKEPRRWPVTAVFLVLSLCLNDQVGLDPSLGDQKVEAVE